MSFADEKKVVTSPSDSQTAPAHLYPLAEPRQIIVDADDEGARRAELSSVVGDEGGGGTSGGGETFGKSGATPENGDPLDR